MHINGFTLENVDKIDRAVNGMIGGEGQLIGGIGGEKRDDEGNLLNGTEILAEYDRLGGLITKGDKKYKVKTGSFYDFKKKEARAKPEVSLLFTNLDGEQVEIADGEALPMDVQAAQMIKEKKGKKKPAVEEEE